jgi:multiple sugar transport system substrate-binding protein
MVEIEFSIITDTEDIVEIISSLLEDFQSKHSIRVKLTTMEWGQAWPTLLSTALYGKGPNISHVGSTWGSSLVNMNVLRPFSAQEIASMGGSIAFIPSAWQSTGVPDDTRVWSLPWTAYIYIVVYRKDIFTSVGINESNAFSTPACMLETVKKLKFAGVKVPISIPLVTPDLVHIAANWVWNAGGSYVRNDGKITLFNHPKAREGLKEFFEIFRYMPSICRHFEGDQWQEIFEKGDAAAAIVGVDDPHYFMQNDLILPEVRKNLGIALLPGIPWIGGDNLVIWSHTQGYLEKETASVALASYLVSKNAQVAYCRRIGSLPVRFDALAEIDMASIPFANNVLEALQIGKAHQAISFWTLVEYQLGQELNNIATDILIEPNADIDDIFAKHLEPLSKRLDFTLSQ